MDVGQVKIDKFSQTVTVGTNGRSERRLAVSFYVGGHGPFTEEFALSPVDPAAINARLAEFARGLSMINSAL